MPIIRYFLTLAFIVSSLSSFSQPMSYAEWNKQAKDNIRLLPEYGKVPKSQGQKDADKEFIEEALKQGGTHREASDRHIKLGFDYYYRGDIKTAMYRFNQAWLLDPKNENVYWGFGAIYFGFNDFDKALAYYDKGLLVNPNNANLLTDKATIYLTRSQDGHDKKLLDKAISMFEKSYAADKTNQNTMFKLSVAYYYKNDCRNALKYYEICKKAGGQPLTEEYTKALHEKCHSAK